MNYYGFMGTQPLFLGVNPSLYPDPMISYITAMDEVRLWEGALSAEEVRDNFHKKVLQEDWLVGYWNFDDLRNRLGYISDLSYKNNRGQLKKGATFTPQHPQIQTTPDSILFYSSNEIADSVIYSFIDRNKQIVAGDTNQMQNAGDTLLFDVSSLTDNISKLNIREFSPVSPDTGFLHTYLLQGLAPTPVATCMLFSGSISSVMFSAMRAMLSLTVAIARGLPPSNSTTIIALLQVITPPPLLVASTCLLTR